MSRIARAPTVTKWLEFKSEALRGSSTNGAGRRSGASLLICIGILTVSWSASAQSGASSLRVATVVLGQDAEGVQASLSEATFEAITLDAVGLPAQTATAVASDAALTRRLAGARRAYLEGDADACLQSLADSELTALLADRRRNAAARVLTWRVACELSAMHAERAQRSARALATYGLDPPAELDGPISPDVAELLLSEMDAVRDAARVTLRVDGSGPARARLDGSRATCELPCSFQAPAGDHVVQISADGFEPDVHMVQVTDAGATVVFNAEHAAPSTAAQQWKEHFRGTAGVESVASLRLLAIALRRPHVAVLFTERRGEQLHVAASLIEDRALSRRSSVLANRAELAGAVVRLLDDLLVAHLPAPAPPIYEEPLFWTVSGVAVLAVLGGIIAATQIHVENPTRVRFIP